MGKKKGQVTRSIHYFDVVLQRLGTEKEKAFVNYQDQSKKLLEVFQYFQKLNIKLKAEKGKKERVHILKN